MSESADEAPEQERPRRRPREQSAQRKEVPAKRAAKAPAERRPSTSERGERSSESERPPARRASDKTTDRRNRTTAGQAAREAMTQLGELTNRQAEGVVGVERTDEGWQVTIEVVEDSRIPNTTDVLAEYEVELDDDGELVAYHRTTRYLRGRPRGE